MEELFEQFVSFFMPDLYDIINFDKNPEFLDQEFNILFPESESQDRRVDKLVKVFLKNGEEKWVLLHIEIQSYEDKTFDKRMFEYYSGIFHHYDHREIDAIAVFTYKADRHKYTQYENKFLKTKVLYEFRTYDISEQDPKELEKSTNPFSFVIRTLIKAFDYKESDQNNFNFKLELSKLLFKSGYSQEEIRKVFRFINFVFEIQNKEIRREFYKEVIGMSVKEKVKIELTDFEEVALEIATENKVKERDKEVAKNFKDLGVEIEKISKATGLTKEQIEKL